MQIFSFNNKILSNFVKKKTLFLIKFILILFFVYTGHRFRTTYDFGFAALDILNVYGEDSGEYTCRATNKLGQATSTVKLSVKSMCF